jgi:hypothetical protein
MSIQSTFFVVVVPWTQIDPNDFDHENPLRRHLMDDTVRDGNADWFEAANALSGAHQTVLDGIAPKSSLNQDRSI